MIILCLDDDEIVRSITVDLLRDLGHDVLEVSKGADAMRCIRRSGAQIDLLLMDIRMPSGPDGRQVAKFARELHPDMPVIYFTAYTGRESTDPTRDWFLHKPCSLGDLERTIAKARPTGWAN